MAKGVAGGVGKDSPETIRVLTDAQAERGAVICVGPRHLCCLLPRPQGKAHHGGGVVRVRLNQVSGHLSKHRGTYDGGKDAR